MVREGFSEELTIEYNLPGQEMFRQTPYSFGLKITAVIVIIIDKSI